MKLKDRNEQLNSVGAIRDFWQDNGLKPKNNHVIFNGHVSYSSKLHSPSGPANVRIALKGYNTDGQITVIGDIFDSDIIHTEFLPQFQDYSYDEQNKSLIVVGNSPKMGGDYKVIITP
ncbi:hypothetical protein [Bacteroides sp.]